MSYIYKDEDFIFGENPKKYEMISKLIYLGSNQQNSPMISLQMSSNSFLKGLKLKQKYFLFLEIMTWNVLKQPHLLKH